MMFVKKIIKKTFLNKFITGFANLLNYSILKYFFKIRSLGKNTSFKKGFKILGNSSFIRIGSNVCLTDVLLSTGDSVKGEIVIDDYVFFGTGCGLFCPGHDYHKTKKERQLTITEKKIHIKEGAWVGARSIILGGVTVGKNSVIGAGAVVTKNIPDNTVYAGNPARYIRNIKI